LRLANAYFLLVFPGLLFIYVLKAQGMIDFERGYTSIVCLVAAGTLSALLALSSFRASPSLALMAFISMIAYFGTIVTAHYCYSRGYRGLPEVAQYYSVALVQYAGMFAIGYSMRRFTIPAGVLRIVLWTVGIVAIYYSIEGEYFYFRFSEDQFSSYPSYQGIALGVLMLGLATIAMSRSMILRTLDSLVLLTVLFLIGARTELAAGVVALVAMLILGGRRWIVASTLAIAACGLFIALTGDESLETTSRQLELLDVYESSSARDRLLLHDAALVRIADNPFTGDYAGQIRDFGELGAYQHNVLDVWRQFGLFGFILFVALHVSAVTSTLLLHLRTRTPHTLFIVGVLVAVTLSIVFSKAFGYAAVAFAWGLAFSQSRREPHTGRAL
jgi:hypothetical protein